METHHSEHMANKTTLEKIAKAAGVSITTVDRVVNQRGGVSPKSEAKVLEWASRLDLDRRIFRAHVKSLRIAVLIPSPSNPFFATMRDAFHALEGSSEDFRMSCFIHYITSPDAGVTAKKVKELAGQYDGIIICSPDYPVISDAILDASKSVPVVTLVNDLPTSGRIAYVGPDNRKIGRAAGELMGRFIGRDGGKVLLMLGDHRIMGHQEREMGFRAVLRERFPKVRLLDIVESEESSERAGYLAKTALLTEPDVSGIYNVSAGNYAIAQTLQELGCGESVILITHELSPRRCELLKSGLVDAVIDQNPRMEARKSLDVLAHHFQRSEMEKSPDPFTPFEIFLRENCPNL